MSTRLLTQSIPDFEESTAAFPLSTAYGAFSPAAGFIPCLSLDVSAAQCRSAGAAGWLRDGRLLSGCGPVDPRAAVQRRARGLRAAGPAAAVVQGSKLDFG